MRHVRRILHPSCTFLENHFQFQPLGTPWLFLLLGTLSICRVGGGALARWPPSASHTARADFPHAAFTKTQVFRDAKEGMNPTRWPINEWTFLAPVRLIQSTSLLGHGRTGFSLKELFRPPISLLIWFPFSSCPSSPAAFPDPRPSPVARSRGFHHAS